MTCQNRLAVNVLIQSNTENVDVQSHFFLRFLDEGILVLCGGIFGLLSSSCCEGISLRFGCCTSQPSSGVKWVKELFKTIVQEIANVTEKAKKVDNRIRS